MGSRFYFLLKLYELVFGTYQPPPPGVELSASPVIECRDVSPPALSAAGSPDKLIEFSLPVSACCNGQAGHLGAMYVRLSSPKGRLVVADWCPRREVAPVTGDRLVVETVHTGQGRFSAQFGVLPARGGATAGGDYRQASKVESFTKLPAVETLVESGRFDADRGIFFKLRQTERHHVSGERVYVILAQVPSTWCGDWVKCEVEVFDRFEGGQGSTRLGVMSRVVALHLAGAADAEQAAKRLSAVSREYYTTGSKDQLRAVIEAMDELSTFARGRK